MVIFFIWQTICHDPSNVRYACFTAKFLKAISLLVTEISTLNARSQRAHEKVGFKTIYSYMDAADEWNVVVWEWKS